MEQLRREMLYGLPNRKYQEFVSRRLLSRHVEPFVDPFMLDVPVDKIDGVYVNREEVYDEISQRGSKIIIGATGSGKTTLVQKVYRTLRGRSSDPPRPLAVSLPLAEVNVSTSEQEFLEGKVSILTPEVLTRSIFSAYWRQFLRASQNRQDFLPTLRQYREWMLKLHWFYHRCSPPRRQILDDFELMTWLGASLPHQLFSPDIAPDSMLRELIRFVTWPPAEMKLFAPGRWWLYPRVEILLDGTERLSNRAIMRLMQDVQKLHDLSLDNLDFKLFVDLNWQNLVENLDCVREGRIPVYQLSVWQAEELREILANRLMVWREEFTDFSGEVDAVKSDDTGVSPYLNSKLNEILVNCIPFESDHRLREIFIDSRIRPWRDRLLEVDSPSGRVQMVIDRLYTQHNVEGENALVLLLYVLSDQLSPDDAYRQELVRLAKALVYEKQATPVPAKSQHRADHTVNWAQEIPDNRLSSKAKEQFINLIVEGALRANSVNGGLQAPIHALRLARAFLAACAGCWEKYAGRPLKPTDLEEIINVYWGEEK